MYPDTFHDPKLQKDFDDKGYTILRGFLDPIGIEMLLTLFSNFSNEFSGPFHTSHFSSNTAYKQKVHDTISEVIFPKAAEYLNDFQPLFGNFMIKSPDPEVAMDLHADWAYVDEHKVRSAAIWVPLIDVNAQNGCLGIIEGSHKITNAIRGPGIRQSGRIHDNEWASRYGKLIPMKAGDAIIYDHALLHYSPPNKTDKIRPALNFSLKPASAKPWIHYFQLEGSDEIELYSVEDPAFYIRYEHFQRPQTGQFIKKFSSKEIEYIDDRMSAFWKQHLLNKFKQWF